MEVGRAGPQISGEKLRHNDGNEATRIVSDYLRLVFQRELLITRDVSIDKTSVPMSACLATDFGSMTMDIGIRLMVPRHAWIRSIAEAFAAVYQVIFSSE